MTDNITISDTVNYFDIDQYEDTGDRITEDFKHSSFSNMTD